MDSVSAGVKPHVVCIPIPLQGHINPMLQLAKLLHHKGFHVTFVNTEYNHKRLLRSRGPNSLDGLPGFHFETIPDGLPPSDADVSQDIPSLAESLPKACLVPLCNLITKLNDTSYSNVPPVTCIVADGCMSFTLDAADKFGIPCVMFWTPSACGFMSVMHFRHFVERGLVPLKDTRNHSLDNKLQLALKKISCRTSIHGRAMATNHKSCWYKNKKMKRSAYVYEAINSQGVCVFFSINSSLARTATGVLLEAMVDASLTATNHGFQRILFLSDSRGLIKAFNTRRAPD